MSANPARADGYSDLIAGFLATFAIFASAIGLVVKPVLLTTFAILLSVIAAGMSERYARFAGFALALASTCFVLGLFFAILTDNPLW